MTTQAATPSVEERLAGIESRLAGLESEMARFLEEQREYRREINSRFDKLEEDQRQFREELRAEQREFRAELRAEQQEFREQLRAEQREFRQENNARLGRVETNLTRVYVTIIGLMGTIVVGAIILRVLG
jgi:Skp family chaperone for outer membrane proteins